MLLDTGWSRFGCLGYLFATSRSRMVSDAVMAVPTTNSAETLAAKLGGLSVIKKDTFLSAEHLDRDVHKSPGFEERVLNAAIVRADISSSFEEYLEILDAFYAEDIEASSGTDKEPIRGKVRVRSLLLNFLIPLHVMAEVGGLSITIRNNPV